MAKQHMQAFRDRQAKAGRKQRPLFLTDTEHDVIKRVLNDLRKPEGERRDWFDLSPFSDDQFTRVTTALAKAKTSTTSVALNPETTETPAFNPKAEQAEADPAPAKAEAEAEAEAQAEAEVASASTNQYQHQEQYQEPETKAEEQLYEPMSEAEQQELLASIDAMDNRINVPESCLIGGFGAVDGRKLREYEEANAKPSLINPESQDSRYARSEAEAIKILDAINAFESSTVKQAA